jgi:hypothetical protein
MERVQKYPKTLILKAQTPRFGGLDPFVQNQRQVNPPWRGFQAEFSISYAGSGIRPEKLAAEEELP